MRKLHIPIRLIFIRIGLDYIEEVHKSSILGEWSNMIGYKMGSSLLMVYTTTKSFPAEDFKHGRKK